MRKAMAEAEVGDDRFGEDPTVNRLQERYCELTGCEAALFVPTGTMANQIALRVLCEPGDRVVTGARQHVVRYEHGAGEINSGIHFDLRHDGPGWFAPDEGDPALVWVEDTHLPGGGVPWPSDALDAVAATPGPVHIDGARLWHACVATGMSPADRVTMAGATTVTCCLSKALGAPVGSVIGMPSMLRDAAVTERIRLGGGWRQAGMLAAAGLVALDEGIERLEADHERARMLAEAVNERWPDAASAPPTNIVLFRHDQPGKVLAHLADEGVLALELEPGVIRFVTHRDIDDAGVEVARTAIATAP
jgi:threonine aldolase